MPSDKKRFTFKNFLDLFKNKKNTTNELATPPNPEPPPPPVILPLNLVEALKQKNINEALRLVNALSISDKIELFNEHNTILHDAVLLKDDALVKALLAGLSTDQAKTLLEKQNPKGNTALNLAVSLHTPAIAISLLNSLDAKGKEEIILIPDGRRNNSFHTLLSNNFMVDKDSIIGKCELQKEGIIKILTSENLTNNTPVHCAMAIKNNETIITTLLSPLTTDELETILKIPNSNQETALHNAVRNGNVGNLGAVIVLLNREENLNPSKRRESVLSRNSLGESLLHSASAYGREEVVDLLIRTLTEEEIKTLLTDLNEQQVDQHMVNNVPTKRITPPMTAADLAQKNGFDQIADKLTKKLKELENPPSRPNSITRDTNHRNSSVQSIAEQGVSPVKS